MSGTPRSPESITARDPKQNGGDRPWHAQTTDGVLTALGTSRHGLSEPEAVARAGRYGLNHLPPPRSRSVWSRLLAQFHNVLIYVLLGAGVITLSLGHWVDSGVIF
ncbi:MAG TPA: cation-transporting P-type ATPase, partial [Gammaproteobacteria bacterium]|nr:cation-transporting P-type ATPase [Gammaproteobacteria bacterium]